MSNGTNESAALVIQNGSLANQQFLFVSDTLTLGREEGNDIVLPERDISRHHASFYRISQDHYEIEDMNSRNGTWVNGIRIEGRRRLFDGDEVHIALKVLIKFFGYGSTIPRMEEVPDIIPSSTFKGRLRIDTEARRIFILNNEIDPPLSLPQYRLIELLYLNSSRVCTRDEVVETVWPEAMGEGVSEQAIDALVRRLRDRLAEIDPEHQYVVTVRGHGFRLDNPAM